MGQQWMFGAARGMQQKTLYTDSRKNTKKEQHTQAKNIQTRAFLSKKKAAHETSQKIIKKS